MFYAVMAAALLVTAAGMAYVVWRFRRFGFMQKLAAENRALGWLASLLPVAAVGAFWFINVYSAMIVFLHLLVAWMLCDFAGWIARKLRGRPEKRYWAGAAAILITAVYLGIGWYCAHHVWVTEYTFETEKSLGRDRLRLVEIADSHLGITLDGDGFSKQMERVKAELPDVVVIAGDFVDDDTEKADMLAACQALGRLEAPDGVYFIFGNHDKGYFQYRNFTSRELRDALEENGVVILEDESRLVNGAYYIIGRQDRTEWDRASAQSLTEGLDGEKYMIMLDHQPNDYDNETDAGADLVLSGHTHGGHIFPAGLIGLAMGANDRVYGTETRENTTFVVTSGISGWAIPFKTGTFSEYVVIDIVEK